MLVSLILAGLLAATPAAPAAVPRPFEVQVQGKGSPVLLVPGLSCPGQVWEATAKRLSAQHEVHVVSLAGFGGVPASATPSLQAVRDGLIRYVQEKGLKRPVLVGHSLGGFLGFWVAETAPDLLGGVLALDGVPFMPALQNPAATAEAMQAPAAQLRAAISGMSAEAYAERTRASLAQMVTDPQAAKRLGDWSAKSDPKTVAEAMATMLTTDLRPGLAKVKVPVLLVGASNPVLPADATLALYSAQVKAAPQARTVLAEGSRHFVMYDRPDFFYAQLDAFLAKAEH